MPALNPSGLDALKKILLVGGDYTSPNVVENDPELALPTVTAPSDQSVDDQGFTPASEYAQYAGNERLKQMLGLGSSSLIQQQRKELSDRDEAINQARIAANPEVSARADAAYKEKLALAGEPNRVKGASDLSLQKNQQEATQHLIDSNTDGGMRMSINAHGEPTFAPPAAEKPLGQQEQALVDSAHQIAALGQPLLAKFAAKYPGIDTDPKKYGSVLADTLAPKIGKAAYMFGGMTDNDELMQDSAAIQAWGVKALASGRITQFLWDNISAHLPQPGFSPGANYDRLHRLITDILPAQLQGVSEGHGSNAMTLPSAPSPSYVSTDPNRGRQ